MGSLDVALLEALLSVGISHDRARNVVARLQSKVAEKKSDLVRRMLAALTARTALLLGAMRVL